VIGCIIDLDVACIRDVPTQPFKLFSAASLELCILNLSSRECAGKHSSGKVREEKLIKPYRLIRTRPLEG